MWNRALATVSCRFCRPLSGSRRAPAETDTIRYPPAATTDSHFTWKKTQGFAPESVFSCEFTRSRSLAHDDVVDMMVRQLAVTFVRNSEVSELNFLWWVYDDLWFYDLGIGPSSCFTDWSCVLQKINADTSSPSRYHLGHLTKVNFVKVVIIKKSAIHHSPNGSCSNGGTGPESAVDIVIEASTILI